MIETGETEAKTPLKKLLKKVMIKTRNSDFFTKKYFISIYSYFDSLIF